MDIHHRPFKKAYCFALILLCLICQAVLAASDVPSADAKNGYQVNVILFSHIDAKDYHSEMWPTLGDFHIPDNSQTLNTAIENPASPLSANTLLPESDFGLSQALSKLNRNPHYQVIWHGAWVQPILPAGQSKPIHITSETALGLPDVSNQDNTDDTDNKTSYINGLLELTQTHYYTVVKANFRLAVLGSTLPGQSHHFFSSERDQTYQQFQLKQTQRIKPNEIHYFDQPLFGLLIKITPYKLPTATSQTALSKENTSQTANAHTMQTAPIQP